MELVKSIVDYNKDFIPDAVVCHEKNQKFIIVYGKYLPVKTLSQMESAETDDGHKFIWKNNQWLKLQQSKTHSFENGFLNK